MQPETVETLRITDDETGFVATIRCEQSHVTASWEEDVQTVYQGTNEGDENL